MDFKRLTFFAQYYLANTVFVKCGGRFAASRLAGKAAEWEALRTRHGGAERWLVVGNGPSLRPEDLDLLSGIPAIASNKINLLFGDACWRPTLYTIVDALVLFKLPRAHYEGLPQLLTSTRGYYLAKTRRKLDWRFVFAEEYEDWLKHLDGVPDPVRTGFLDGYTVTTANIQLAMWLGAKTIYLIGCDHFYQEDRSESVKKLAHEGGAFNHFHPDYRKPGEIVNNAPVSRMEEGYRRVKELAERNGIKILNITRKTALEVFEKSAVEEVLDSSAERRLSR